MRFATRALVLAALLVLPAGAAADPLAALAAANGHPAATHVRLTWSATIERRRYVMTVDREGTRSLSRLCVSEACSGRWFDGTRGWEYGLNDVALPADDGSDARQRTVAAIVSLAFAEPAFRASGGTVEPAGPSAWRVRAAGGTPLVAAFDSATLGLREIREPDGTLVERFPGAVRAGGVRVAVDDPLRPGGALDGVAVVAEPLRPPAGAAATFAGDPDVALGNDAIPIVPCTLGGRAARCLLDSGATPSAITLPLAEALHLEARGELELSGYSRFATGFVDAGPLAVGGARFAAARFAVIPSLAAAKFDVVVGADLLARVRVVFDRASRRVTIGEPDRAAAAGIPLRFVNGTPHVAVTLDGRTADALFDSGDAAIVSLGYAQYRVGTPWPVVERLQAFGIAGTADAFVVAVPQVVVGTIPLGALRATVARTQDGVHVGYGLASRCAVMLDEARERLSCGGR